MPTSTGPMVGPFEPGVVASEPDPAVLEQIVAEWMEANPTEFQASATHIQYKTPGEDWENLVPLSAITGATGATGAPGLANIGTPVTPARTLGTNFIPNATRPCLVGYSFELHTVLTALGTSFAQVQLFADPSGTPTTERSRARHQINLGVGLSVNQQSDVVSSVYAMIPAGWVCRLVATTGNGGTVTPVAQTEVPLTP